jgi:SAM-dependent methyltransferase
LLLCKYIELPDSIYAAQEIKDKSKPMPLAPSEYKTKFNEFAYDYNDICDNDIEWTAPRFSVEKILKKIPFAQSLRIHDIGAGTAKVFTEFNQQARHIDVDYYGCDLSDVMISYASEVVPLERLTLLDANEDPLPWENQTADLSCSTTKKGGLVAVSALCFRQSNDGSVLIPTYEDENESMKRGALASLMRENGLHVLADEHYVSYVHGPIDHYDNLVIAALS